MQNSGDREHEYVRRYAGGYLYNSKTKPCAVCMQARNYWFEQFSNLQQKSSNYGSDVTSVDFKTFSLLARLNHYLFIIFFLFFPYILHKFTIVFIINLYIYSSLKSKYISTNKSVKGEILMKNKLRNKKYLQG